MTRKKPIGFIPHEAHSVHKVGVHFDRRIGKEGVLSMPTSRSPSLISLLSSNTHSTPPVCEWIKSATTEQEMTALLLAVQGIPSAWLEWTEKEVKLIESRDREIQSRVAYALATLWNGVTLLQECKFLCDVLENALRTGFICYVLLNKITYAQIYPPKYQEKIRNISKLIGDDPTSVVHPGFIFETGFEQLTKTMALNWKSIPSADLDCKTPLDGFSSLFWDEVRCRDVNLFQNHMSTIRKARNDVAHTKRLFSNSELRELSKLVCIWLKPLNVEIMQKVAAYRNNRPRFLQDLDSI